MLLECDLLARRDAFLSDSALQQTYWQSLGLSMPEAGTLKISLFAYENAALAGLFDVWANGPQPVDPLTIQAPPAIDVSSAPAAGRDRRLVS